MPNFEERIAAKKAAEAASTATVAAVQEIAAPEPETPVQVETATETDKPSRRRQRKQSPPALQPETMQLIVELQNAVAALQSQVGEIPRLHETIAELQTQLQRRSSINSARENRHIRRCILHMQARAYVIYSRAVGGDVIAELREDILDITELTGETPAHLIARVWGAKLHTHRLTVDDVIFQLDLGGRD